MTKNDFDSISVGMPAKKIIEMSGKPYQIKRTKKNTKTYVYLERFKAPNGQLYSRHYLIDISGSKVKDKAFYVEGQKTIEYLLND